ncbi:hypothetical protein [Solibacillus isronensis]|uniref:hypothetical protein n=1 Tax=Solibacillus isronensis TaxID=412383 RepID=UPI0039A3D511
MNTFFTLLLLASFAAVAVSVVLLIVNIVRKKNSKTVMRMTGISTVVLFVSLFGSIFTSETKEEEVASKPVTAEASELKKEDAKKVGIDMAYANDTSVPLEERIQKIATDLYGSTTSQKTDRNISVESMGDLVYLNLMIDDGITLDNTLWYAQYSTVELLKVLQQVEDFQEININWQGNFKDASGNSNVGSAVTAMFNKEGIEGVDFEAFDVSNLKNLSVNYGVHNDFK